MSEKRAYVCGSVVRVIFHPTNGSDSPLTEEEEFIVALAGERDALKADNKRLQEEHTLQASGLKTAMLQARDRRDEIVWLKAIVDKLDKTADGVPMVGEMDVWYWSPYTKTMTKIRASLRVKCSYVPPGKTCQLNIQQVPLGQCCSTLEAAAAAKDGAE